jgi:hypothetical protein
VRQLDLIALAVPRSPTDPPLELDERALAQLVALMADAILVVLQDEAEVPDER